MHSICATAVMLRLSAAARRQSQNPNEPLRILLIVARVHGERRKIGAIERVIRLAADDADIALIERQRNRPSDVLLRSLDESVERFAQRREPQPEVNKFRILEPDMLLEVQKIPIQAQRFKFVVSGKQQRASRSLVTATRLNSNKAVLNQIDAPYRIATANFIEQFNQRYGIKRLPSDRNRHALFESDFNLLFFIGRLLWRLRQLPGARERRISRVF